MQGFLQFRSTGETERLDVDTLNERLQHRGATRLRHVQAPDEKFGMIFSFDGCVGNTRGALVRACAALAARLGRPPLLPHQQQALALRRCADAPQTCAPSLASGTSKQRLQARRSVHMHSHRDMTHKPAS